tara:strand:+ start:157 stop:1503 length:1347 start_codon:yes stop_codon:yes gene_type:complete
MPHSNLHITTTTSNPSNLYSITVIEDANINDPTNSVIQYTPTGVPFYTMKVIPNNYAIEDLVISGNFKIDGITSSWSWNADLGNGQGSGGCYPPDPPYYNGGGAPNTIIKNAISHPYVLNGTVCWPSPFIGNGTYRFQGPYVFDNSTYCDGAFLSSSDVVTWRKIILIDVYEMDSGMFANGGLSPAIEEDETFWATANAFYNPFASVINDGFPAHLHAFVFPEYHPTNPLTSNMHLDLDFDYIPGYAGCTDPSSLTYDPLATTSNPNACTYGPAPLAWAPLNITSDISPANHTLYTVDALNGGTLNAPIQILVLNNFDVSIPTPTGGVPPYQDMEINNLADMVTTSGSPAGSGSLPSQIMIVDDANSTIDPLDPTHYLDMHTTLLSMQGTNIASFGTYSVGSVILSVPGDPVSSNYSVQDITIEVIVEDDNLDTVTSSVSADLASQYN